MPQLIYLLSCSYDFGMPTVAKIPEFLRNHEYKSIDGSTAGPWQYATNSEESLWDWIAKSEERLDITHSFMEGDRGSRPPWVEWFPVEEQLISTFTGSHEDVFLVDVAGGRGHDIRTFREKFPQARGRFVLEDLEHVIEQSVDGLAERIAFDLFKSQPVKGMKKLFHVVNNG